MPMLAPDILAEARGLPVAISGTGIALGLALWTWGWRYHRFWIVLFTTLLAGIFVLASGPPAGAQPLVAAVLLGTAAVAGLGASRRSLRFEETATTLRSR